MSPRIGTAEKAAPRSSKLSVKGERARQSILDAFLTCLKTQRMSQIKVADITRLNGMNHSHFYAYFKSLDEVVAAIAQQVTICPPSLLDHVRPDWAGPPGLDHARALVKAFLQVWNEKREFLQMSRLLADEVGGEFLSARFAQYRPLRDVFEAKVREAQARGAGLQGADPAAVAFKVVILLASAGNDYPGWMSSGFSDDQMIETTARMLHLIVTGGS